MVRTGTVGEIMRQKSKQETENRSMDWFKEQLGSSLDVVSKELNLDHKSVSIIYIKSIVDQKKIDAHVIKPFYEMANVEDYQQYLESLPEQMEYKSDTETLDNVLHGCVVIHVNTKIVLLEFKNYADSSVGDATIETVIQGPQKALSENLGINLNLIRHRYHQASLRILTKESGTTSKSQLLILYDEKLVDPKLLTEVQMRLSALKLEMLQSTGQVMQHLSKQKRSLFPTMMLTERPDRIAFNLSQGKIVILLEGTTFALILPAVFYDFLSTMEDNNHTYWISKFLVILRYIGLFINVLLPSLYLSFVSYTPEILRIQLTFSISGSRASVPYPTFVEMLFLLIVTEMLIEASIRLPKQIGPTATTVGGLILGQAASQAGLVSNIMIIIVAAISISNFVIPVNEMSFAIRVAKYVLLLFSIFLGLIGVILGFIGLIVYLCNLESFNRPYLKLFMVSHQKPQSNH